MSQPPQIADFQRNVGSITQKSEAEAHAERLRITSDAIMKGAGQSNRVIIAVIIRFERLYDKTVEDVMWLIADFAEGSYLTQTELGAIARVEMDSFADRLLGQLPGAGFPHDAARLRGEYREKFRQRLDGALRDIQIGFIGGRKITTATTVTAPTASKLSDAVTLNPTFMGMSIDLPRAWSWVRDKWRGARQT